MATDAVPADELRKAKDYLIGRTVLGLEDPRSRIMFGLRRELLEDGWVDLDEVIAGIEAVTAEDVLRVADRIVVPRHTVLTAVGPLEDAGALRAALGA